jgi:hypothetical protein
VSASGMVKGDRDLVDALTALSLWICDREREDASRVSIASLIEGHDLMARVDEHGTDFEIARALVNNAAVQMVSCREQVLAASRHNAPERRQRALLRVRAVMAGVLYVSALVLGRSARRLAASSGDELRAAEAQSVADLSAHTAARLRDEIARLPDGHIEDLLLTIL